MKERKKNMKKRKELDMLRTNDCRHLRFSECINVLCYVVAMLAISLYLVFGSSKLYYNSIGYVYCTISLLVFYFVT